MQAGTSPYGCCGKNAPCQHANPISAQVVLFINMFVVCVFAAGFYDPSSEPPDIGLQNAGVS